jgi:hypothetical protein
MWACGFGTPIYYLRILPGNRDQELQLGRGRDRMASTSRHLP